MAERIITAIDIGSTKISTIIASMKADGAIEVIGVATAPSQGLKKGVIVNIDDAINSIASCLESSERMAGLSVRSAYISINGKHITSLNNKGVVAVAQEEINMDDVMRSIESASTVSIPPSREIIHILPREYIVDAQGDIKDPVGMTGTRLEVNAHIISATSSAVHNLKKCILQLGLQVDDVVFTGYASSNCVLTPTEKELGIMCLDIGGGTTSITTFVDDAITYSGSVPFGGINVTSDIAIGLRVSLEEAEKIKLNAEDLMRSTVEQEDSEATKRRKALLTGQKEEKDSKEVLTKNKDLIDISSLGIKGVTSISKKLFNEIIEARLSEIFDIVIKQVEQSGNESRLPAGIVITGGSALLPGISSIAKKVFGVPARVAFPPQELGGLVDEIESPAFSVGQGLILYGSTEEGYMMDNVRTSGKGVKKSGKSGSKILDFFKNLLP